MQNGKTDVVLHLLGIIFFAIFKGMGTKFSLEMGYVLYKMGVLGDESHGKCQDFLAKLRRRHAVMCV